MRGGIGEALKGQLTEGRQVLAVAVHQEQLSGALRPSVQTGVYKNEKLSLILYQINLIIVLV